MLFPAYAETEPAEPLPERHPLVAPGGGYIGAQTCAECHQHEYESWQGSHHARSMEPANEKTVLGDFNNATFTYEGVTSTFFRQKGQFMVRTDGPDGALRDYEIAYTFGFTPLQQYLIGFPDGRYQMLGIAWDSRPQEQGGQRWFHLYPDQNITPRDPLHWTGLQQNWNYMCAECHSTNLHKNYDPQARRFHTTWSEINVSCEACHGPGADHLAWANQQGDWQKLDNTKGLAIALDGRRGVLFPMRVLAMQALNLATTALPESSGTLWNTTPGKVNAPQAVRRELELCARCHSRRGQIWEDYQFGQPLLDTHRPALLTPDLYYPDGQMKDEVFNHGSFLQSKMFAKGVTCSDCHEPHSGKLRAAGNAVCLQCHLPAKYETPAHHFHPMHSASAECVACHAPTTTYMVVDPRHDHSFQIPRPALSVKLGIPNACTRCHEDQSAEWAAKQVEKWYGDPPMGYQQFAEALHTGALDAPGAQELLRALVKNADQPNIARATGITLLGNRLNPTALDTIRPLLTDADPLLRATAAQALQALPPELKVQHLLPLLDDPVRLVRIDAARTLANVPKETLSETQQSAIQRGVTEVIATEKTNAERPEAWLNIGLIYTDHRQWEHAEVAYRTALELQPDFTQAAVNLADLYRLRGRDEEGEKVLRQALSLDPHNAAAHHALGLLLIRQKQPSGALAALAEAARLGEDNPRYGYVYAVALNSVGQGAAAIQVLKKVLVRHPNNRDALLALTTFQRDAGERDAARESARRLTTLEPESPQIQALLRQLSER